MIRINDHRSIPFALALLATGLVCVSCDSGDNKIRSGQAAGPQPASTQPPIPTLAKKLPNLAKPAEHYAKFIAAASHFTGCHPIPPGSSAKLPSVAGQSITFSGLRRVFGERSDTWVYVKDSKNCHWDDRIGKTEYIGILNRQNKQLTAFQVELDVGRYNVRPIVTNPSGYPDPAVMSPPTDLEAVCVVASAADKKSFTVIAAESGGYAPTYFRRLFKIELRQKSGGLAAQDSPWQASITGTVNYHKALGSLSSNTDKFEVEGMLCKTGAGVHQYGVILADRGDHLRDGSGRDGGLVKLQVDFGTGIASLDNSGFASVGGAYVRVRGPRPECAFGRAQDPNNPNNKQGWRDIADLYSDGHRVWSASSYEDPGAKEYCSKIYVLCQNSDCSGLNIGKQAVFTRSYSAMKIEGLAAAAYSGIDKVHIAMGTDEESRGEIRVQEMLCEGPRCEDQISISKP